MNKETGFVGVLAAAGLPEKVKNSSPKREQRACNFVAKVAFMVGWPSYWAVDLNSGRKTLPLCVCCFRKGFQILS